MLSGASASDMATPATADDALVALGHVSAALGHVLQADRMDYLAEIIASGDWTRAELRAAVGVLSRSTTLRDAIRFGRTITPADFEEARRGDERTARDAEDGTERVVVTLRGFALKVRQARLYTQPEALALWRAMGEPGGLSDRLHRDGTVTVDVRACFALITVPELGLRFRLR